MPPSAKDEDVELARWYREEVLAHRDAVRGHLQRLYPKVSDLDELVQEACVRVLDAHRRSPLQSGRAYLFATARNLAVSVLRRRQVAAIDSVAEMESLRVLDEGPSVPEMVGTNLEVQVLIEAIQSLPDRCRQVLTLRRIYGLSQKEIAARLGIAEHTVEAQLGKGMRRCTEFLRERGILGEHE